MQYKYDDVDQQQSQQLQEYLSSNLERHLDSFLNNDHHLESGTNDFSIMFKNNNDNVDFASTSLDNVGIRKSIHGPTTANKMGKQTISRRSTKLPKTVIKPTGTGSSKPVSKATPSKVLVNRRKTLRRSMSYDTLPKMKNKMIICQPMTIQRRITVPTSNKIIFRAHKTQHLVLICLAFISFTSMLAMAIIAPFFPTESAKKGMRESINGLVFSVYAFVFMICSPIISLMIPVIGTKMTLIVGIFIAGVSNILFGLLDQIQSLETFTAFCFIVRTFEAVGGTAFSTATYTILMEEFPDNVGTAFVSLEKKQIILPSMYSLLAIFYIEYRGNIGRLRSKSWTGYWWLPVQYWRLWFTILCFRNDHVGQYTTLFSDYKRYEK